MLFYQWLYWRSLKRPPAQADRWQYWLRRYRRIKATAGDMEFVRPLRLVTHARAPTGIAAGILGVRGSGFLDGVRAWQLPAVRVAWRHFSGMC
ncbi:hypothetical protein [Aquipseudomonas alcaligenes]|uniref:hypothetical protein n=1 Tax=Aquipseudomonas alcaligenes TaxID=43263 RepID=UPI0011156E98|nr:hypothetical protein [Pseudomonas alcaligenes]